MRGLARWLLLTVVAWPLPLLAQGAAAPSAAPQGAAAPRARTVRPQDPRIRRDPGNPFADDAGSANPNAAGSASANPGATAAPANPHAAAAASASPHATTAPANPHAVDPQAANPHAANPHGGLTAPKDVSSPDESLPIGTIRATIVDGAGLPLPGVSVRLGKMFQSIAQGDQRRFETQTSNAQGEVSFSKLDTTTDFSYRITVSKGPAEYATTPFRLAEDKGQRVLLHVYPVTTDLNQTRIMMRGLIYVEPRDDTFQFEIWFQIYNLGETTWVPQGVGMQLPEGSQAFSARESMSDVRFETDGDSRAKLLGTFSPGQHDARFSFNVDNPQDEAVDFNLVLPPQVAEFRVVAAAAKGMSLSARDFPPVEVSTGPQGERVLITQKRGGNQTIDSVHFELSGLPTRGNGPWLAVLLAAFTAGSGVYVASNSPAPAQGRRRRLTGDMKRARDVLLEELVQLELARANEKVGPKSYERTHRALITALARIMQPSSAA